jgi:hypothetical protein
VVLGGVVRVQGRTPGLACRNKFFCKGPFGTEIGCVLSSSGGNRSISIQEMENHGQKRLYFNHGSAHVNKRASMLDVTCNYLPVWRWGRGEGAVICSLPSPIVKLGSEFVGPMWLLDPSSPRAFE